MIKTPIFVIIIFFLRQEGIEPPVQPWKGCVLPLHYWRTNGSELPGSNRRHFDTGKQTTTVKSSTTELNSVPTFTLAVSLSSFFKNSFKRAIDGT